MTPAVSGVTLARRDIRNSRTSARLSMSTTVGRATPTREAVRRGVPLVHRSSGTPGRAAAEVRWWTHRQRGTTTMRAVVMYAPGDVRVDQTERPTIVEPTDAVIKLAATCI